MILKVKRLAESLNRENSMHLGWRCKGKNMALSRDNLKSKKAIQIGRADKEQCEKHPEAGLSDIVMDLGFF